MKKLLHIGLLTTALCLVCSCTRDKVDDLLPPDGREDAQIHLRLRTPGGYNSSTSRALTFEQENTITDIHVLVFNATNALVFIKQGEVVSSTPGNDDPAYSGEASFSISLPASRNSADTYNLVVLANGEDILTSTIGNDATKG